MIRINTKFLVLGIILVFFIFVQVYSAEVKITKPEVTNEAGKTIISIPVSVDAVTYTQLKFQHMLCIDIADGVLVGAPKQSIPVADSVVTKIIIAQYQSEPKTVRAVIQLKKWVPFDLKQEGKAIVLKIDNTEETAVPAATEMPKKEKAKAKEETKPAVAEKKHAVKEAKKVEPAKSAKPVAEVKPVAEAPAPIVEPKPAGLDTRVTIDFSGAELPNVIRILADKSGLNIVAGPEVTGKVTIHLVDVPVKEALATILAVHGFSYIQSTPNVVRIVKSGATLLEEAETEEAVITLNYITVDEIITLLTGVEQRITEKTVVTAGVSETKKEVSYEMGRPEQKILPGGLKVLPIKDNNALIVPGTGRIVISGTPATVKKAKALIKELDKPIKQVMIDARLIEINIDKSKDLGIEWNATKTSTIDNGPYSLGYQTMDIPGTLTGGLLFGTYSSISWNIGATLKAAIENNTAEILANPRILALNNTKSSIAITREHPYITWSYDATKGTYIGSVNFEKKSGITLEVTPQITDDGHILLHVVPSQKQHRGDVQYTSAAGVGAPLTTVAIIDERTADVTMLIKDGQPIVIGGLRDNEERVTQRKIPMLGDLPVIGNIFKSKTSEVINTELMLFVTPYILKEQGPLSAEEKINYDKIELK